MYITNSNIGRIGRLGNALFQYALLRSISVKTNKKIYLHDITKCKSDGQLCLLSNLKLYINKELEKNILNLKFNNYNEEIMNCYIFSNNVFNLHGNINYNGYFQSYKYFNNIKEILQDEFTIINKSIIEKSNNIIANIKKNFENMELVALHVRGGDKLIRNDVWWNITEEYLIESLKYFNNNVVFIIFNTNVSEYINNMIYNNIPKNKRVIIQNDVLTDFNILKSCDHYILTNSSFGWWAAYLSDINKSKIVIHPNYIFTNKNDPRNNITDYIPDNWIII